MRPIYQGKPPESQTWLEIPADFVPDCKKMGYEIRGLVLREDAERAVNEALERAAQAVEIACLVPPGGGSPTEAECGAADEAARRIRALKIDQAQAKVAA